MNNGNGGDNIAVLIPRDALLASPDRKEEEAASSTGASSSASAPSAHPTSSKPTIGNNKILAATEPLVHHPASPVKNKASVPTTPAPRAPALGRTAIEALRKAILNSAPYDSDGFVNLAEVGNYLIKLSPDLNARNYGFPRLMDFVIASGIVVTRMRERPSGNGPPLALVKLKD